MLDTDAASRLAPGKRSRGEDASMSRKRHSPTRLDGTLDKCGALVVKEREPSPVGTRPSLSLGPTRRSDTVTQFFYGNAALEPMRDGNSSILVFKDEDGSPPADTDAARIFSEYNLGPLERAQLHVLPTPGLALQALRNDDRKHTFGEVLFECGATGYNRRFVVSKKYLPSRPLPEGAPNDLYTYVTEFPNETRRLWPQLWAQLLAVGASLHQGESGIVHHDIKPENLVVEKWSLDPPAVRLRLIDFEHAQEFVRSTTTHALYTLDTAPGTAPDTPHAHGVHPFRVPEAGNHTPAYAAASVQLPVLRLAAGAGANAQNMWSIAFTDMWSIAMTAFVAFTGHFMAPLHVPRSPHYVILSETWQQMTQETRPPTLKWDPSSDKDPEWAHAAHSVNAVVEVALPDVRKALMRAAGQDATYRGYAEDVYRLFQLCNALAIRALSLDKIYDEAQQRASTGMLAKLVEMADRIDAPPSNPLGVAAHTRHSVWDVLRLG